MRLAAFLNLAAALILAGCANQEYIEYCRDYGCVEPIEQTSPWGSGRKVQGWIIREEF